MGFIAPFILPLITALAPVATAAISLRSSQKSSSARQEQQREFLASEAERERRERRTADAAGRLQRGRAAGTGQSTILGGEPGAGQIGRNVLLGQ